MTTAEYQAAYDARAGQRPVQVGVSYRVLVNGVLVVHTPWRRLADHLCWVYGRRGAVVEITEEGTP